MEFIKVYGERNTNTNYFSKLIELNLSIKEIPGVIPSYLKFIQKFSPYKESIRDIYFSLNYKSNLGWKHTSVKNFKDLNEYKIVNNNLLFVTITKNPYSWLLSLHRKPYHHKKSQNLSFKKFLQSRWKTVKRDNTQLYLKSPIDLWNIKNNSYFNLKTSNVLHITSEMLIVNPEDVISDISSKFNINRTSANFKNYNKSTKDKDKDSNFYKNYYLKEKWKQLLDQEAVDIINHNIDKNLMKFFDYDIIDKV